MVLTLSVLLACGTAVAQSAQGRSNSRETSSGQDGSRAGRFEEVTSVVVVEVPVQVIRDGEPVRELTAEDFVLYDGRRRQELIGFDVIDLARQGSEAAESEPAVIPSSGRRHFLLLFDLSLSDPESILRARRSVHELVHRSLHPADLVAVATYTEYQGARLVLNFTSDREQVETAIDTLGLAQPAHAVFDPLTLMIDRSPTDSGRDPTADALPEALADLQTLMGRVVRDQQKNQIVDMSDGMKELALALSSIGGQKHVVLLSEGFRNSVLTGIEDIQRQHQIQQKIHLGQYWAVDSTELYGDAQAGDALADMIREFTRANCTIQAIDIGGLDAGPDADRTTVRDEGLFRMADGTGGGLYQNFNQAGEAFEKILERTSVTYVLAFSPDDLEPDGRYHRIRVELVEGMKGARVVHRPGYYPPKPFGEQSDVERRLATAAEILGGRDGGSIPVSVLSAAFPAPGDLAYVPVLVEVDGPGFLGGLEEGTLVTELYSYALDRDGKVEDFFARRVGLDLDAAATREALLASGFKYWGHLDLEAGDYVVRTLVRNGLTGESSLRSTAVTVPAGDGSEPLLLPPFFPEPVGRWLLGRESPTERPEDLEYPFLLGEQPFIPAARPTLTRTASTFLLAGYHLSEGPLALRAELSIDGTLVAAPDIALLERTPPGSGGIERLIVRLDPGVVPAGEYMLALTVSDPAGEVRSTSRIAVVVRDSPTDP